MALAIGFDLGETLFTYAGTPLSWAPLYRSALTATAAACALQPDVDAYTRAEIILTRHNTRQHPRTIEIGAERIFTEILGTWDAPDIERFLPTALTAFFAFFQQRLIAYPESVATLTTLRAMGVKLGALTDVPYGMPRVFVENDLRASGLNALLNVLLTSVEVGERKPAPTGFHVLAAALHVPTTALWYIGNEEKDIVGARGSRAIAVLIDRENRQPSWGQTHTIRNLQELPRLVSAAT